MLFAPLKGSGAAPGSSVSEVGKTHPMCSSVSFVLSHMGLTDWWTIEQQKIISFMTDLIELQELKIHGMIHRP